VKKGQGFAGMVAMDAIFAPKSPWKKLKVARPAKNQGYFTIQNL